MLGAQLLTVRLGESQKACGGGRQKEEPCFRVGKWRLKLRDQPRQKQGGISFFYIFGAILFHMAIKDELGEG